MYKAVVTEALGFIGYELCCYLLQEGIEVAAIDELDGDKEKAEKYDYFGRNALFTFFEGKMGEVSLENAFDRADVCFYIGNCSNAAVKPGMIHDAIVKVSDNIRSLFMKTKKNAPLIIHASSTEVYGKRSGEIKETEETLPASPEGIVSLVEEALLLRGKARVSILRFPEIYGPNQPDHGGFHRLLNGGKPDREPVDVLFIEDAVRALYAAAEYSATGIYNVASGKANQWHSGKRYITEEETRSVVLDTKAETWFDIEKAEKAFQFKPKISLEKGIDIQKRQMRTE